VPGRKFTLSSKRLLNRTITARIIIALSAPAFAIAAIVAAGGFSASAQAQPASQVRLVNVVSSASALTPRGNTHSQGKSAPAMTQAKKPKKKKPVKHKAKTHKKSHKRLTPKQIAWNIMSWFHWKAKWQFRYLNWLWNRESSWNVYASNPYSGAYGIPQALPGSKMATCGSDWQTSAKTQIRWGMRYIKRMYGSPKGAWDHEVDAGWY
jgi:hypothetical protein